MPSYAATYQVPPTIASDCSVDVTQPILSWIASVPDDSILFFGTRACYRIDGTLELRNRNGLEFEGNGASFKATTIGATDRSHWRLVGGSRFYFRGMTIRGASPVGGTFVSNLQHQHAFDLKGVAGVELDHVNASDLYGDCVYVGKGLDRGTSWSSNVYVHGSTCTRSGRMGIAVVAGRDVLVETSSLSQIALTAFDIEPNGAGFGARNVTFRDNQASGVLPGGFFTVIGDGPVDSVTVSDNTIVGVGMYMAVLARPGQRRSSITITGNSTDAGYATGSAALDFERIDGLTVVGNTIPLSGPNMALASVSESCDVKIQGNSFPGGVVEARTARPSCTTPDSTTTPRRSTSTTLQIGRGSTHGANPRRGFPARRAYGRVKGSRSGRVVIRLERLYPATRGWARVSRRKLRVGIDGGFVTRLRARKGGRWRARATFRGTLGRAPSRSRYRYFLIK